MSPRRSIDESQHVLLPLCEGCIEIAASASQRVVAHSIDNETICVREATRYLHVVTNKRRVVDIVLDQDWTKVDVPVAARGTMDDERTSKTIGILFEESAPAILDRLVRARLRYLE